MLLNIDKEKLERRKKFMFRYYLSFNFIRENHEIHASEQFVVRQLNYGLVIGSFNLILNNTMYNYNLTNSEKNQYIISI